MYKINFTFSQNYIFESARYDFFKTNSPILLKNRIFILSSIDLYLNEGFLILFIQVVLLLTKILENVHKNFKNK